MLWFLVPLILVSNILCVLYCIKPSPDSLYSKIRKAILYDFFSKIGAVFGSIIGPKPLKWFRKFKHYLVNTNNPITQIFYILLFPGLYTLFIFKLLIPNFNIYPLFEHILGHSIVFFSFFMYYKTCSVDPGTVTKRNVKYYMQKHVKFQDGSLFRKENCATCTTPKPARSKHCRICNICVSRLDHHCIWIRGCVGEHNYKYFLGFISSHSLMCFYGAYIALKYLDYLVARMGLWNRQFQSSSGEIHDASFWVIFRYLFDNHEVPMFLFTICSVLAFALLGFFMFHLNLIRKGVSMSEAGKLADFTAKMKRTKADFEKRVDKFKLRFPNYETDVAEKRRMQVQMRAKFDEEWKSFQHEIDVLIRNYHSRTFWQTLREVLRA